MLRTKFRAIAACFTILGLLVPSCAPALEPTAVPKAVAPLATAVTTTAPSPPKPAAPSPTPKPAAEQPRYGGILSYATYTDPPSLDIHQEVTTAVNAFTDPSYSTLLRPDELAKPDLKPGPDLATSWEMSPDGKVYTFHLVKGAKFHDGSPVTAEDVKFSLERSINPQPPMKRVAGKEFIDPIDKIDTPDDSTIKITLKYPRASFVLAMAMVYFSVMPKRYVLQQGNDMTKTIVGSGPFKLKSYASGGWR